MDRRMYLYNRLVQLLFDLQDSEINSYQKGMFRLHIAMLLEYLPVANLELFEERLVSSEALLVRFLQENSDESK